MAIQAMTSVPFPENMDLTMTTTMMISRLFRLNTSSPQSAKTGAGLISRSQRGRVSNLLSRRCSTCTSRLGYEMAIVPDTGLRTRSDVPFHGPFAILSRCNSQRWSRGSMQFLISMKLDRTICSQCALGWVEKSHCPDLKRSRRFACYRGKALEA